MKKILKKIFEGSNTLMDRVPDLKDRCPVLMDRVPDLKDKLVFSAEFEAKMQKLMNDQISCS